MTGPVRGDHARDGGQLAVDGLDEQAFQAWYGPWRPRDPAGVAALFAGSGVGWYVAGGRAARAGAAARQHADIDVVVVLEDLARLRMHLRAWHLWEAHDGTLHPLLPGADLRSGREQLWLRRDAQSAWEVDLLLQPRSDRWVFRGDPELTVPWDCALHEVDGVPHLRPELALLNKAHLDRPRDRADLDAAVLDERQRRWLVAALERLGHARWAELAREPRSAPDLR